MYYNDPFEEALKFALAALVIMCIILGIAALAMTSNNDSYDYRLGECLEIAKHATTTDPVAATKACYAEFDKPQSK